MSVMSNREFKQNADKAERLSKEGPVFINEEDRTVSVLLSFEEYLRLSNKGKSLAELLSADDDYDFDPPRMEDSVFRPAEFD
jgi:hypothetical protein